MREKQDLFPLEEHSVPRMQVLVVSSKVSGLLPSFSRKDGGQSSQETRHLKAVSHTLPLRGTGPTENCLLIGEMPFPRAMILEVISVIQ